MIELIQMEMYRPIKLTNHIGQAIISIMSDKDPFRCHCNGCQKESVFIGEASKSLDFSNTISLRSLDDGPEEMTFDKRYICQLDSTHAITIGLRVTKAIIQKIGQFPSVADIKGAEYERYQKILGPSDYSDFKKANLLHSFSMDIGAFVYLRRIIENLVQTTYKDNASQIQSKDFANLHFDQKVKVLGDYLPNFFTRNTAIYSLLSKGIHELSESECKDYYDTILNGTLMILDEKQAKEEIKKRKAAIEKGLQAAVAAHAKKAK